MAAAARSEQDVRWNFVWAALCGALFELAAALVGLPSVNARYRELKTVGLEVARIHFREDPGLVLQAAPHRTKGGFVEQIAQIERPGVLTRTCFKIGERMFGQVPTPERLMARRLPLMFGIGGLYGAIEWFGTIDSQLRALLNVQVATLYSMPY